MKYLCLAAALALMARVASAAELKPGEIVHPKASTAGCASAMIVKKVQADLDVDRASADADDLMAKNHCTVIIGADAALSPMQDGSSMTYRMILDHGDGIGLFVLYLREPADPALNDDSAFFAPLKAFAAGR